jgi:hypothetical protein
VLQVIELYILSQYRVLHYAAFSPILGQRQRGVCTIKRLKFKAALQGGGLAVDLAAVPNGAPCYV